MSSLSRSSLELLAAVCLLVGCPALEPPPPGEGDGLIPVDRAACLLDPDCDYLFSVAHRGAGFLAPENTLVAIALAQELGADSVELDVRPTADEVLILMHDSTVDRTTDGSGEVSQLTLEQIRKLSATSDIEGIPAQPVPTFLEALQALGPSTLVNLDAKTTRWDLIHQDIVAAGLVDRVWVQTDSLAQATELRDLHPELIQMADAASLDELDALLPTAPELVEIPITETGTELFDRCLELGIKPAQNALGLSDGGALGEVEAGGDGSEAYGRLVDRGDRILQTDLPELLVPVLDELNALRGWKRPEESP